MINLDYPLTRPFPVRWLAPLAFTGAAIGVVFLTVLNTALTAYQVRTEILSDFDATWSFWYSAFLPASAKNTGGNCDPVSLSTGSIVSTNNAIFAWTVDRVILADAGRSGFKYTGFDLDSCDITAITIDASISTHTARVEAFARCDPSPSVAYTLRTSFTMSDLAARFLWILGGSTVGSSTLGYGGQACNYLVNAAGVDLLDETVILNDAATEKVVLFTASTSFQFCPASNSSKAPCSSNPPVAAFESAGVAYSNGTFEFWDSTDPSATAGMLNDAVRAPIANLHQVVAACARLDFGQNATNNIMLNPAEAISSGIILAQIPALGAVVARETLLGYIFSNFSLLNFDGVQGLPVPWRGKSVFDVAFFCRIKVLKPAGEAFIAVLVATLSMFMSGWAIFMFVAIHWLKRNNADASNCCVGHCNQMMNQPRPHHYSMPSGMSDCSKTSAMPVAMPSPGHMVYTGNGYQYQPAGQESNH